MHAGELAGQYQALVYLAPDKIHVLLSWQVNTYLCFQLKTVGTEAKV